MSPDPDLETYQTVAFGLAMLSLGVWFGNRVTGELAARHQTSPSGNSLENLAVTAQQPDWINTVQTINDAVLAVFVVCMVGVLVADYYSRDEEERPTLESLGLRSE